MENSISEAFWGPDIPPPNVRQAGGRPLPQVRHGLHGVSEAWVWNVGWCRRDLEAEFPARAPCTQQSGPSTPGIIWPSVFKKPKSRWGLAMGVPNDLRLQIWGAKKCSIIKQPFKTPCEIWSPPYIALYLQALFPDNKYCTGKIVLLFQFQLYQSLHHKSQKTVQIENVHVEIWGATGKIGL